MKIFVAIVMATTSINGAVFVETLTTLGPEKGSPYHEEWQKNAFYALRNNLLEYGDPPSMFQILSDNVEKNDILSFILDVDPSNRYPDKLKFIGIIKGEKISLSEANFRVTSSDPYHIFGKEISFEKYHYSDNFIGVKDGKDGILGTYDDIFITQGGGSQKVDALYILGIDIGLLAETEGEYNLLSDYIGGNSPFAITGTFSYETKDDFFESSSVVTVVPEPEAYATLSGIFLLAFACWKKFRC